jgi:hypothetical protein
MVVPMEIQNLQGCANRIQMITRRCDRLVAPRPRELTHPQVNRYLTSNPALLFTEALTRWDLQISRQRIRAMTPLFIGFALGLFLFAIEEDPQYPQWASGFLAGESAITGLVASVVHLRQRDARRCMHHYADQMSAIAGGSQDFEEPSQASIWMRAVESACSQEARRFWVKTGTILLVGTAFYLLWEGIDDIMGEMAAEREGQIRLAPYLTAWWN